MRTPGRTKRSLNRVVRRERLPRFRALSARDLAPVPAQRARARKPTREDP
jgi:hypothetical protein